MVDRISNSHVIVLTTINSPTEAVRDLAGLAPAWALLAIGDNKTPADWKHPSVTFLSISAQRELGFALASLLPENHYCRKNLGYLMAISGGADVIAETDDDNLPAGWPLDDVSTSVTGELVQHDGWVNVYHYFTDAMLWPRGFPLEELSLKSAPDPVPAQWKSSVHQYLAAGDPDVDAIYRLTIGRADHEFSDRTIGLAPGAIVPFNSQSTVWFPPAYPLLYLPSFVSFRMTDIWRSFVAQVCLWAVDDRITYHGRGVRQIRNSHDLLRDFSDEVVGYQRNSEIMRRLRALPLLDEPEAMGANMVRCYEELNRMGVVPDEELPLVHAWVADVQSGVR